MEPLLLLMALLVVTLFVNGVGIGCGNGRVWTRRSCGGGAECAMGVGVVRAFPWLSDAVEADNADEGVNGGGSVG